MIDCYCAVAPNPGGWAKQKQKMQMQMQMRVAYTAQGNLSLVPFEMVTGFGKKRRRAHGSDLSQSTT